MYTQNGFFATTQRFINLSIKNCKRNCSAHTGNNSDFPHYYFFDNYYVKTAIQIISLYPFTHVFSKTVFLRKNNDDSYTRIKANKLTTGAAGSIYFYSENTLDDLCGDETYYNQHKTKQNRKVVNKSDSRNLFSVDYHSLSSYLSAYFQGHDSNLQVGASISN